MNELTLIARELQKMGRDGDTILAHISPTDAEILRLMGGAGSINPYTGLPEYKKLKLKNILKIAAVVVAVVAPQLIPAIGEAVASVAGATVTAGEAAAIGSSVVSAASTALQGGDAGDIVKSAITGGVSSVAGQAASQAVGGGVAGGVAGGAASGATQAALTGQDVGRGALTGGALGGIQSGVTQALTPAPTLTGTPDTSQLTFPQNLQEMGGLGTGITPRLAPLPEASTIGTQPIDYGNIFAPPTSALGYQAPRLRELPQAATIGRQPIDYKEMFTPEVRNLPSMGGGTGLMARDASGMPVQLAPPDMTTARAGGAAARQLASYLLQPKRKDFGYFPTTSTPVGAGTAEAGTPSGTTPGSAALAQALRTGEPIDVATGKGARRPVWNIASLRVKDETGS